MVSSDILRRLDNQAQTALTGSYSSTNSRGTRVTSKPVPVSKPVGATVQRSMYDRAQHAIKTDPNVPQTWVNGINTETHYLDGTPKNQSSVTSTPPPATTPPPTTTGVTAPPVAPPPTAPTGPGGAGGGEGAAGMLDQFTGQEIESALAALEAQYGMTREQLLADQSLIGAEYRLLMARLNRSRQMGIEGATNDAVARGIYNSGILGENIADVETQYMEEQRATEAQRLAQEQAIQGQLDFLDPALRADQAGAEASLRREQANYYMQAGISPPAGAGNFGGASGGQLGQFGGAQLGGAPGGGSPNMGALAPGSLQGSTPGGPTSAPPDQNGPLQQQYTQALQALMAQGLDPSTPEGAQAFGQIITQIQNEVGASGQWGFGYNTNDGSAYAFRPDTTRPEGSGYYRTSSIDRAQRKIDADIARMTANPQHYNQEQLRSYGLV